MSESCIVIHLASRDVGMGRDADMGISRDSSSIRQVDASFRIADNNNNNNNNNNRPSQISSVSSMKSPGSPRQVTENGGEMSECGGQKSKTSSIEDSSINPKQQQLQQDQEGKQDDQNDDNALIPSGNRPLTRTGPSMPQDEEQQSSSSGPGWSESYKTLPQHERIQEVEPLDISYQYTEGSLKMKSFLLSRLTGAAPTGRLQVVDLSRRGLGPGEVGAIVDTIIHNAQLAVLKVGYNNLGDEGAALIAGACLRDGKHHQNLSVLDMGFNGIGDAGAEAIALKIIAGNHILRTIFLSGNNIRHKGALSIAGAILHGCSLHRLHLSANKLGPAGIKVLTGAIAESDVRRQQLCQRRGGIITMVQPIALEDLRIEDTNMSSRGFEAVPNMLLTNSGLRVLSLSNNEIDDKDMALLSQAITQNKALPLASLQLSHNKITCVGVECLMNAIWGSQTLREIKLDNNKIQDRGAQLCSVVLSSIHLEMLNLGFNKLTTVGIKAIMKSLSENDTLRALSMAGIPMDQNASKAVSYAIAYNSSLEVFNVDSCCIGYSGQRHIVAGIVSNRNVRLRSLTGFPLGPIVTTLGVPQLPEGWGNDRVLTFMRFMWAHWRSQEPNSQANGDSRGPAPPSTVAASAKKAFVSLSETEEAKLLFQAELNEPEASPVLPADAAILVRSVSGQNLQIPSWDDALKSIHDNALFNGDDDGDWSSETGDSLDHTSYTDSTSGLLNNIQSVNPERRNKNLLWLRKHYQSLNEVGGLVFNNADLWQLHQYFFSPVYNSSEDGDGSVKDDPDTSDKEESEPPSGPSDSASETTNAPPPPSEKINAPPPTPVASSKHSNLGRAISFQTLGDAVAAAAVGINSSGPNKRRSLEETPAGQEPCAKRAKNLIPRIAYYPRIREKLESLGAKPSAQTLSLLRQLKYIESVIMLTGKTIYAEQEDEEADEGPSLTDVEMILLDLL